MLNVKKLLTQMLKQITITPVITSWSNQTPTSTGQSYNIASMTLAAGHKYIVLAVNSNSIASAAANNVSFTCSGASNLMVGAGVNNSGNGNNVVGWAYVVTGSSNRTLYITSYGYVANATWVGRALAIPLGGGYRNLCVFNAFSHRKVVGAC